MAPLFLSWSRGPFLPLVAPVVQQLNNDEISLSSITDALGLMTLLTPMKDDGAFNGWHESSPYPMFYSHLPDINWRIKFCNKNLCSWHTKLPFFLFEKNNLSTFSSSYSCIYLFIFIFFFNIDLTGSISWWYLIESSTPSSILGRFIAEMVTQLHLHVFNRSDSMRGKLCGFSRFVSTPQEIKLHCFLLSSNA